MTDGEIREVVNELRKIAKNFCYTQQLRERISSYIVPILQAARATAEQSKLNLSDRLIAAIEGECEGLAITDMQATNILAYLQYGAPMDDVLKDAERYRKLRNADIESVSKGGVFAGLTPDNVVINGEDLDIAVDLLIDAKGKS